MRGPNAFRVFVESLREEYDWLVEALEEEGNNEGVDDLDSGCLEPVKHKLLT